MNLLQTFKFIIIFVKLHFILCYDSFDHFEEQFTFKCPFKNIHNFTIASKENFTRSDFLSGKLYWEIGVLNKQKKLLCIIKEYNNINKGRIDLIANGFTSSFYYYDNLKGYEITNGHCTEYKFDAYSEKLVKYGEIMTNVNDNVIIGQSAYWLKAFEFIEQNKLFIIQTPTIQYDFTAFLGCDDDMAYVFYVATHYNKTPLRLSQYINEVFVERYDILIAKETSFSENVFKLPEGVNCQRKLSSLVQYKQFNNTNEFFVRMELILKSRDANYSKTIEYYNSLNRIAIITTNNFNFIETPNKIVEIYDKQIGKHLFLHNLFCKTTNLNETTMSFINTGRKKFYFNQYLFESLSNFNYLGKDKLFHQEVDVFETTIDVPFQPNLKAIITRYYETYQHENNLLQVTVNVYDKAKNEELYSFNVIIEDMILSKIDWSMPFLDVSNCFKDVHQHQWVRVTFTSNVTYYSPLTFEMGLRNYLRTKYNVDQLLLPTFMVHINHDEINVLIKVLQVIDIKDYFLKEVNQSYYVGSRSFITTNIDQCLSQCLNKDDCQGAFFCNSLVCVLKESSLSSNKNTTCLYYEKINNKQFSNPSLTELITTLKNAFKKNSISFLKANLKMSQFIPNFRPGIRSDLININENGDTIQTSKYFLYLINYAFKKDHPNAILYLNDHASCANICDNDNDCNSYSFCKKNFDQSCVLAKAFSTKILFERDAIYRNKDCYIFIKNFLSSFKSFGNYYLTAKPLKISSVDLHECAQECYTNKQCKSFDFNLENNTCILRASSILEAEENSALTFKRDDAFEHYQRNHLIHYIPLHQKKLKQRRPSMLYIEEITVEGCAQECMQNNDCSLFEFCSEDFYNDIFNTGHCYQVSKNDSNAELVYQKSCIVYRKLFKNVNYLVLNPSIYSLSLTIVFCMVFALCGALIALFLSLKFNLRQHIL